VREGEERPGPERRRSGTEDGPIFEEEADGTDVAGAEDGDALRAPPSDVLADMEAFRREVDELRERFSRGEG